MDKGSNDDFDMKSLFEKQKAASANNRFSKNKNTGTKNSFNPPTTTKENNTGINANAAGPNNQEKPFEIDKETEVAILEMVNTFVSLANKHAEARKLPINLISDAFLYAAARYNAFLVASADQKSIAKNQKEYIEAFVEQYKAMLKDHFDFYKDNPL